MRGEINESGLTDKQERFAHEYLIDQNASAAALRAGYSANSHRAQASQLMADPDVRRRVKELLEELYALIKVNALMLMQERLNTAFFDPRCLVDAQSRVKPLAQWDDAAAAVMHVSFDTRADGESVMRARQPSRGAALSALERRFANFMRLQEENTITERERDDAHRAMGRDPATVKPGEVFRFSPEWARRDRERNRNKGVAETRVQEGVVTVAKPEPGPMRQPAPVWEPEPEAVHAETAVEAPREFVARPVYTARQPKVKEDKYWCDLDGNINVEHPHCPPEVRARELEKRRRREGGNRS